MNKKYLEQYERLFISRRQPYLIRHNDEWVQKDGMLNSYQVRNHIQEKKIYSVFGNKVLTKRLAFDLDNHNNNIHQVYSVYDYLQKNFGVTPLTFQSSLSGSLHSYYLLDRSEPQENIIPVVENKIKIYNNIEVRCTKSKALRLPLGEGSFLLDTNELLPLSYNKTEQLEILSSLIQNEKIEPLSVDEIYNSMNCTSSNYSKGSSEFLLDIQELLDVGLVSPGTRNDSLLKLSWYYQAVERKSPEETKLLLTFWISKKHNGFSKDWNSNPNKVLRQIEDIVHNFDHSKVYFKPRKRNINLSDVKYVESLSVDKDYQKFLVRLIELKRSNQTEISPIPSRLLDTWNSYNHRDQALKDGYLEKFGSYWHGDNIRLNHCQRYKINLETQEGREINLTDCELNAKIEKYGVRGLARKVGVSPGYISDLKNGRKKVEKISLILQAKIQNLEAT